MPLRLSIPLPGPFSYSTSLRMRKRTTRRSGKGFGYLLISPFLLMYWMLKALVLLSVLVARGVYVASVWTVKASGEAYAAYQARQARRAGR